MINIILFGPPGAGKGTQSKKIADKYELMHISTGEMLREEIKAGTLLGSKAKEFIDKGEYVPDDVLIHMMQKVIKQHMKGKGFIFDGFPRTTLQAKELDVMMDKLSLKINRVFVLDVEEKELIKRIMNRGIEGGRSDDKKEIIQQRMNIYHQQTEPLIHYYSKQNKVCRIGGIGVIDEIFMLICKHIESIETTLAN